MIIPETEGYSGSDSEQWFSGSNSKLAGPISSCTQEAAGEQEVGQSYRSSELAPVM